MHIRTPWKPYSTTDINLKHLYISDGYAVIGYKGSQCGEKPTWVTSKAASGSTLITLTATIPIIDEYNCNWTVCNIQEGHNRFARSEDKNITQRTHVRVQCTNVQCRNDEIYIYRICVYFYITSTNILPKTNLVTLMMSPRCCFEPISSVSDKCMRL